MRRLPPTFKVLAATAVLAAAAVMPAPAQDNRPQCGALPHTPAIPDGNRSSEARMQEARQDVTAYLEANAAYRECLAAGISRDEEGNPTDPRLSKLLDEIIREAYDTAELVADTFNHNLRKFERANQ